MEKCSFCGKDIRPSTGKIYIKKDGKMFNFCTNKCEKNQIKLRRKGREQKWTDVYAKEKAARKHD